jgi:hypothetical protein
MNAWTSTPTGRIPFQQLAAKHDAGANGPVLRSSDNTKCGNRFHEMQDDSMETDDCATALFNDEVAPHPHPQV